MKIDDKIRHEKLEHDINREVAKMLALSSGKNDKYEYNTGEEISEFLGFYLEEMKKETKIERSARSVIFKRSKKCNTKC